MDGGGGIGNILNLVLEPLSLNYNIENILQMNSLGLILVEKPSIRLTEILSRNKLSKPIQIIESTEVTPNISNSLGRQGKKKLRKVLV